MFAEDKRTGDAHKHRGAVNPCPEPTVGSFSDARARAAHTSALLSQTSENREEASSQASNPDHVLSLSVWIEVGTQTTTHGADK